MPETWTLFPGEPASLYCSMYDNGDKHNLLFGDAEDNFIGGLYGIEGLFSDDASLYVTLRDLVFLAEQHKHKVDFKAIPLKAGVPRSDFYDAAICLPVTDEELRILEERLRKL